MLDPNARVTFVDGYMFKKDLNNFGPTAGFAWDVTKDGKTAVRGGYSLTFVNEDQATVARSASRGNAGLSTAVNLTNLYASVAGGIPLPAAPPFLNERTLAQQNALSATGALWGIDPDIKSAHVHQVSVGIQREIGWATAVEARYVGTFGRNLWRGIDFNQMRISPEFLADFNRAHSNGFLAQQAGKPFSPVFDATVPGSQQLTVLTGFGSLTNATAIGHIQTNQVAALADFYITNRTTGALQTFMPNGGIYASQAIVNGAFTDYNALQIEVRRRFRGGFFGQLNYTLSDTNTDSGGTAQSRLEVFMDNARPELNTGRSQFHVTHVVTANAIYELPFGAGQAMGRSWRLPEPGRRRLAGGIGVRLAERLPLQLLLRSRHIQSARTIELCERRGDQLQPGSEHALCRRAQGLAGPLQGREPHLLDRPEGHRCGHRPCRRCGQPDQRRRVRRTGVLQS